MNTNQNIKELNQILEELNLLRKRAEAIHEQLDNALEHLPDKIKDSDYSDTLEDARDDLESALWDGFDAIQDNISDAIFNLSLLDSSSTTPIEYDILLDLSDQEEIREDKHFHPNITSAILGHHLTQHHWHFSNNANKKQPLNEYNPFDTHGESSFDWKDHNEDGYDDRNDGFWTEKEF